MYKVVISRKQTKGVAKQMQMMQYNINMYKKSAKLFYTIAVLFGGEIKLSLEVGYTVAQNSQGWAHYIYNHRVNTTIRYDQF